jgi:hypothetical protein
MDEAARAWLVAYATMKSRFGNLFQFREGNPGAFPSAPARPVRAWLDPRALGEVVERDGGADGDIQTVDGRSHGNAGNMR